MSEKRISKAVQDPEFTLRTVAHHVTVTREVIEDAPHFDQLIRGGLCVDSEHMPPNHLVIKGTYRHVCPACGTEQVVRNMGPVW